VPTTRGGVRAARLCFNRCSSVSQIRKAVADYASHKEIFGIPMQLARRPNLYRRACAARSGTFRAGCKAVDSRAFRGTGGFVAEGFSSDAVARNT
jgi:hypothetical protein